MHRNRGLVIVGLLLCPLAPAVAQLEPMQPANPGLYRIERDENHEAKSFAQTHPDFAENHPKAATFYQDHPVDKARALGRYGEKQFASNHPNFVKQFVKNNPGLARYDYRHPLQTEAHPGRALGFGKAFAGFGRMAAGGIRR